MWRHQPIPIKIPLQQENPQRYGDNLRIEFEYALPVHDNFIFKKFYKVNFHNCWKTMIMSGGDSTLDCKSYYLSKIK